MLSRPTHGAQHGREHISLAVTGPETVVVSYARDRCHRVDFPDLPARAFRDAAGNVHLFAAHFLNYASIGRDLTRLKRNCNLVFAGKDLGIPSHYSDRSWLSSFYTKTGNPVWALIHNEFRGNRLPGSCRAARVWACWYNTVTYAKSTDNGFVFEQPPAPDNLVFAAPYRYNDRQTSRVGAFTPTNIVSWNGYKYAFFVFETPDRKGICVARTADIVNPKSWQGWDGREFALRFVDPYRQIIDDAIDRTCLPLANLIPNAIGAVAHHKPTGKFIALQPSTGYHGLKRGVYYSVSEDLINWTTPQLLFDAPMYNIYSCDDRAAYGYPSILDTNSDSRIFSSITDHPDLYLTRFNLENCQRGLDRDLVRLPLRVERK